MHNKHFFLDQYGCAKNQVDGELIIGKLLAAGWERAEDAKDAQLIIINSCGFIEAAKKESLDAAISARKAYPDAKILFAGCLAERYSDDLYENLSEVDGIFGNGDIDKITSAADAALKNERPLIVPEQVGVSSGKRKDFLSFEGSAYVKITEGCDNCCSFCAIPLIRGGLRSRSPDDVLAEIKSLLGLGVFEINLVGQDLAVFGMEGKLAAPPGAESPSPLSLLLRLISELSGKFWVRLLYIHPDHFPADILPVLQADSRILPYFDIPFQSGAAEIIRAMNRKNTPEHYISLVENIRAALPDAVLRTTFLTGFPGESEENFAATAHFLEAVKPDWSGCFAYSREEDTPAASFKKQVSKKTALTRKKDLEDRQLVLTQKKLLQYVGKTFDVLLEEHVSGYAIGRAWFQAPEVDGAVVVCCDETRISQLVCGTTIPVHITGCTGVDLEAIPAEF